MQRVAYFVRFFQSGMNFSLLVCLALLMLATHPVLAALNNGPKPAQSASTTAASNPSPVPNGQSAVPEGANTTQSQTAAAGNQVPKPQASAASPAITFVQITDAHLFDGGKKRDTVAEAQSEQKDTWDAFRWAIRQTNALIDGGAQIDFVVFTGDMGLDFVRDNRNEKLCKPYDKNKDDFLSKDATHGMKFYTPKEAAQVVADEFRLLKVKTIYILPGNNDLANEAVCDMGRYKNFVKQTASDMAGHGPKLFDLVSTSDSSGPFRLLGLNSAAFKVQSNYQAECASIPPPASGCPDSEIATLRKAIEVNDGRVNLVFTHIPDVMDPLHVRNLAEKCAPSKDYEMRVPQIPKDDDDKSDKDNKDETKKEKDNDEYKKEPKNLCGSWTIADSTHLQWVEQISSASVVAVFAGHLHDANRANYATTADNTPLYNGIDVARKTWIAPPLALKYQDTQCANCRARGLLLVRVQKNINRPGAAVSVIPFWYLGEKCNCGEIVKSIAWLVAFAAVLFLFFWIYQNRENEIVRKLADMFSSPPVFTLIGLAITTAVFWELLGYVTNELSVPRYYYLVLIFGAFGGLIGSVRSGNEVIWVSFEKASPFRLGLLGDILLGMGGATAISVMFDNPLHIKDNDSSETMLLISVSFIAGVVGRNLVQAASAKLLRQVADDAAQKAVEKAKSEQVATASSQSPATPPVQSQPGNVLLPNPPASISSAGGKDDPKK